MTAWEKQRFLGSGSYGQVHLAVLKPAGEMKMAVKSAAIQDYPFIVRCFGEDVSMEHGQHVYNLLLEYAPGGFLKASITCTYTLGIIHYDLKPQNVLVFPGKFHGWKRLKLCDFGLAKFSDETNVYGDSHRGTIQYAAPGDRTWRLRISGRWGAYREPGRRWTAEMLLSHPFLERLGVVVESKKKEKGFVNPLGALRWSSSRDLFTVLLEKEKEKEVFDLNVAFKEEREEEVFDLNVVFEEEVFDLNVFFKEEWKREEVERCFPGCLVHWS
nr:mitogen-activated protein kinase kinase kinase NPK1-like [Ipomoea batatas]